MPRFQPLMDVQLTSKDEFRLRLGEATQTGAMYYLGIDPQSPDHDCPPARSLQRLFRAWLQLLLDSRGLSGPCYLPFDFADESTQWLACELSDNMIHAVFGWAEIEGWAISPTDFRQQARHLPEFSPAEPAFVQSFYLPRLLSDLRRVIATLGHEADESAEPPTAEGNRPDPPSQ